MYRVQINDISHAPPYRIENLTKQDIKILQSESARDDFDIIHPYQIISFAWRHPLKQKLLKVNVMVLIHRFLLKIKMKIFF